MIVVYPPASAALQPLPMVSAASFPVSRRCTCASTNPGSTSNPVASSVSSRAMAGYVW